MNAYTCSYRVAYRDVTVGNHIYYSRYLELLEYGRGEFFRHLGRTFQQWQEQGATFPVVECHLRYHTAAKYDDLLTLRFWVTQARGARINFGSCIENQAGRLVLEGETFHACADLDSRPKRLPGELISLLQPYLVSAAEGASEGDGQPYPRESL